MRVLFLIVFFLIAGGQSDAAFGFGSEPNCRLFWKAYSLPAEGDGASSSRHVLFAVTALPPQGEYLYGPESTEGLPTRLDIAAAPLEAFPMQALTAKDIRSLTEEAASLDVRMPPAPLKSETIYAGQAAPGGPESNPAVYPGATTFWAVVPEAPSAFGGVALRVELSGLLCSASSCTPAFGELVLAFSAREMKAFPPAENEEWWAAYRSGEAVSLPLPEEALSEAGTGDGDLAEERPLKIRGVKHENESPEEELERYKMFFATLQPAFFKPELEVQFLGEALIFGLLAGLLLNLMPCVLPVVSLKFSALMAVSAMKSKRRQARAFRMHCLIFALGILVWFAFLAFMLGVVGWAWGELFQQPVVLVGIGLFLFLMGLSMFGVFNLPLFDLRPANDAHPHWQAFISGLVATLLATPCSGPLLGGVLAWAMRQPLPVLMLSVVSIGVGMAFPYGLMALHPRLVHLLPRPGSWTLRLEQLLGFFLMGSVVYLATLLPEEWTAPFLFNLLAVALAAWLWGQIGHLGASRLRRAISRVVAVAVVVTAALWGSSSVNPDADWETFEAQAFMDMLGKDQMLVEFTADWCPNCKALEHTTLNRSRMAEFRRQYNARTIRVDLTRNADAGMELLRALDSTSIPVIALFPKGEGARNPVVLRDIVTPELLDDAASSTFSTNFFP